MLREMFKSKIHMATVTHAELYYEGSITVDQTLLEIAEILPGEKVQVVNLNNGSRFETYTIVGEKDSGVIGLNGPAARLGNVGDKIIILTYAHMSEEEAKYNKPNIVLVDEKNRFVKKL